ncbi:MAG: HlyC/CorC family transporter [Gemmatimonadetes bacterium]|nr:HlyC/CorC family transporter [Gemmatimonadota bacterium]
MIWLLAGTALVSIFLSALCSASETATTAVGTSQLRTMEEEGFRGANALAELRTRSNQTRAALLFLNTLFNTLAVGTLVLFGSTLRGTSGGWLGLLVGSLAVLILAQGIPRLLASRHPIRFALAAAPALLMGVKGLVAVTKPIRKLAVRANAVDPASQEERDVRELTQLGQEEGLVGEDEHLLVERAFRLDELTAWDVMTPRVDIFAWKDSLTLEEIIGELKSVPYSRVPVYKDTTDDISGILHVREVYEHYVDGRTTMTLSQLARDPLFVPGSLPLTQLLHQFQARRIHMGIIADEFGGTDGLATLEDILEELVGEIVDETDVDEEALTRISKTEILAPGGIDVREINYAFNVALPQLGQRSLNGFILEELGHVPEPGETVERAGVKIEILTASDTQVLTTRLTRIALVDREESE